MLPLIGLIAKENLSTAIVICAIMVGISFVASKKKAYFFIVGGALLTLGTLYIKFGEGFRAERIKIWLDVENHEKGFQILQGLYAIASGGIFGTGLGESMQKLGFIPESHYDMIFAIICEELGLFGAIAVILLFLLLIWRLFIIAISAPDLFGGLICVGVLTHIAVQVIINIAVVTNSIPSTGIPLPFISYGGTSVAILLAEMGIVLSVSNQIKYER
jgi:cell division protein FtsW